MINQDKEFQAGLFSLSDIIEIGEDPFDRGKSTIFYESSNGRRCYVWVDNLRKSEQKFVRKFFNKGE